LRIYSNHYARWYTDRFGNDFDAKLIENMKTLPDSREMFQDMPLPSGRREHEAINGDAYAACMAVIDSPSLGG